MLHKRRLESLFNLAAEIEPQHKARIVAAIYYGKQRLCVARNRVRTDPFHYSFSHSLHKIHLHAETSAIKQAIALVGLAKLEYCVLYVARAKIIQGQFHYGLVKPCVGCQRAIQEFNIRECWYTLEQGSMERL